MPEISTTSAVNVPRAPLDLDAEGYTDKHYVSVREKGLPAMRLKIDKEDAKGLTHKLKSQEHFWEGTEDQFRASFDPAPSSAKKDAAKTNDSAKQAIADARATAKQAKADAAKAAKTAPAAATTATTA